MADFITSDKGIQYRIDAEFKPTAIKEICIECIENYCVANGETAWLLAELDAKTTHKHKNGETITDKDGQPKLFSLSFPEIRSDFTNKFFKEIIKGEPETVSKLEELRKRLSK